uniref:N-acetylgalactosaminide beta-1,3-galactosyltransferase n=2 Tax=Tetranychus urticae TaxID=32264 RepID=T1KKE8_TETUR
MLSAISWKIYKSSVVGGNFQHFQTWPESSDKLNYPSKLDYWTFDFNNSIPDEQTQARLNSLSLTCLIHLRKFNYLSTINSTWASRCNESFYYLTPKELFNSSLPDNDNIALIKGSTPLSTILSSWQQFCLTVSSTKFNTDQYTSSDWFLIAPENTFFIIENLRRFLISFNSSNSVYLGRPINNHAEVIYNSFDSGIVLSRSAFLALMEAIKSSSNCSGSYIKSIGQLDRRVDVAISQILHHSSCKPIDTRDKFGRGRFLALPMSRHMIPGSITFDHPFWQQNIYPFPNGPDCCSDGLVAIPGLTPNSMRFYEYLIYTMRVVGIKNLITS